MLEGHQGYAATGFVHFFRHSVFLYFVIFSSLTISAKSKNSVLQNGEFNTCSFTDTRINHLLHLMHQVSTEIIKMQTCNQRRIFDLIVLK